MGDIVCDSVSRREIVDFLCVPTEIWRTCILRLLSLCDVRRLDFSVLNHSLRSSLLTAFVDAEIEAECILSPDSIDWLKRKAIKPLRVKLIVDINEEKLLQFTQYCPQLISLSTWDFEQDAQLVQTRNQSSENSFASNARRSRFLTDVTIITILQRCTHLKTLKLCEMVWVDWCATFIRIAPHCTHLEEIHYQDPEYVYVNDDNNYNTFSLTRTTCMMDTHDKVPAALLASIATNFSSLSCVYLDTARGDSVAVDAAGEVELLELARCCTRLMRVMLVIDMEDATIIEFCRLCPRLVELQLCQYTESIDYTASVLQALQYVPGLEVFCCCPHSGMDEQLLRGIADSVPHLRVLGIEAYRPLPQQCWEYVLGKCTKLRTILSEANLSVSWLHEFAANHGVAVAQGHRRVFHKPK